MGRLLLELPVMFIFMENYLSSIMNYDDKIVSVCFIPVP